MKKIYCNKTLLINTILSCIIVIDLFILLFIHLIFNKLDNITQVIIALAIVLVTNSLFLVFSLKRVLRKYGNYILIDDDSIEYRSKKESFKLSLSSINEITYKKNPKGEFKELTIHQYNDNYYYIVLSKNGIKKLSKLISIPIISKERTFKENVKYNIHSFKDFLIKEKYRIVFTIIGLFFSITSIVLLLNFKKNIFLITTLCIINFIYCVLQLYYLYFKKKDFDRFARIFLSIISTIGLMLIFFVIISIILALLKVEFNVMYILICSALILPSFVVVIGIIALLLLCLSYA